MTQERRKPPSTFPVALNIVEGESPEIHAMAPFKESFRSQYKGCRAFGPIWYPLTNGTLSLVVNRSSATVWASWVPPSQWEWLDDQPLYSYFVSGFSISLVSFGLLGLSRKFARMLHSPGRVENL